MTLPFLPAYTPQLNPAERLWPLEREAVANWPLGSSAELDRVVGARCVTLHGDPVRMCRAIDCRWWPWC